MVRKKIEEIYHLIGNKLKLEICFILSNKKLSLTEITKLYEQNYGFKKYRETIFRALDSMLKSNLIEKLYDVNKKKILYSLRISNISIDFKNKSIKFT